MSIWRSSTTAFLIGGVVLIIIAAAIAFMVSTYRPRTEVLLGGSGVFYARLATTETSRQLGLSGVEKLEPNEGLLMVFDTDDTWEIWMNDMKIPIDIIWLDSTKEVVYMVKNASPELSTSTIFRPNDPARYVLELQAGSIQESNIKVGDKAAFELDEDGK